MKPGHCAEPRCEATAAWGARTKAAWCQEHAAERFRECGLDPLEEIHKATTFTLTRCRSCGCQAHYKLEYALSTHAVGEMTCRACFWRGWAASSMSWRAREEVSLDGVRTLAESKDYEYLGALTTPSLENDPHHVRCLHCGRLSAERPGDIAWGCSCQRRTRRQSSSSTSKTLLKSSDHPALKWWDHEANDPASLATATLRASREAHWLCPTYGHRFTEKVLRMTSGAPHCPECDKRERAEWQRQMDRYRSMRVSDVPELVEAWDEDVDPALVGLTDNFPLRRFTCPNGHHPRLVPLTYMRYGCNVCRAAETRAMQVQALESPSAPMRLDPEMAAQWHPTANARWDIRSVSPRSKRLFTWRCAECGHEWLASPKDRSYAASLRCPQCRSIFDSLAYHHPDLAAEWSTDNPRSAWQVRPTAAGFTPTWVCSTEPTHVYSMSLASRTQGGSCPECSEHGKSRVELDHHRAAKERFGHAASGKRVSTGQGQSKRSWNVDIAVQISREELLLIEYDGAYWHRGKQEVDLRKTQSLLKEGHRVVRLREHPLESLPLENNDWYLELTVYATAPDPEHVMDQITAWTEITTAPPPVEPDGPVTSPPMASTALPPSPAAVRAWARENGYDVGDRGRLSERLLSEYQAAHSSYRQVERD